MQSSKIIIAGFSGAGKSTFLQALKETTGAQWEEFSDLDGLVLERLGGLSIAEFVEKKGWESFRKLEALTLKEWLERPGARVLALGGGTLSEATLTTLESRGDVHLVHLKVDFITCWKRIQALGSERPLVRRGEDYMKNLFEERSQIYQKIPQVIENDGKKSPRELALEFWSRFRG